jgi:hypothetical protein
MREVRGASGQAVAGMAAAARSSGVAGSPARLTGALAVTLGVAAACWVIAIRRMSEMDIGLDVPRLARAVKITTDGSLLRCAVTGDGDPAALLHDDLDHRLGRTP